MGSSSATYFATPERLARAIVERQRLNLVAGPVVGALLDSFPEPAVIVNDHRQLVRVNTRFERFVSRPEASLVGTRLGEAIGCRHGQGVPNGCGTTPACALCGAAKAIEETHSHGRPATEVCGLTLDREHGQDALDFQVSTTPFRFDGEMFTVFAMRDISHERRRRVLERMFFHDVLNAASGLRNILVLWPEVSRERAAELNGHVAQLAGQIVEEVEAQRDLAAAERGELSASRRSVNVAVLLNDLSLLYRNHAVAEGRALTIVDAGGDATISTDPVLLRRILGNLVKNALEASERGQTVTVAFTRTDRPRFSVHNDTEMPRAVRLQVFQRSFSTKNGDGHGIGTYSARLLAERYLGGRLTFTSVAGQGTTFVLELPPDESQAR